MPQSLQGKAALVTGGSRGIGRAIAIALASQGASVVIGYHQNDARAREVVQTITEAGGNATAVQADLARATEVTRMFEEAKKSVGAPDIVVVAPRTSSSRQRRGALGHRAEHRCRRWSLLGPGLESSAASVCLFVEQNSMILYQPGWMLPEGARDPLLLIEAGVMAMGAPIKVPGWCGLS